jgi:uncharacterized Fe-S center protein
MKSTVYFIAVGQDETPEQHARKALKLYQKAGFAKRFGKEELIGIKQHLGEKGGNGYLRPPIAKAFAKVLAAGGSKPFVTDSTTLYRGQRADAVDYLNLCQAHGFTSETLGCPVIIADGLRGNSQVMMPIKGKHYSQVPIASVAYHADGFVVLTHVTGHVAAGFGASIKNVAMGLVSRAGKMSQHHGSHPIFKSEKCTACGACARWCPAEAITVKKVAVLDKAKCIGCGECLAVCRFGAVGFDWGVAPAELQEKMAEHCLAVHKHHEGKIVYFNFATHITRDCDCFGTKQKAVCDDVGILAGDDPVAVDQATLDLLKQEAGGNLFTHMRPEIECDVQVRHGEAIGLGTRDYELVRVK